MTDDIEKVGENSKASLVFIYLCLNARCSHGRTPNEAKSVISVRGLSVYPQTELKLTSDSHNARVQYKTYASSTPRYQLELSLSSYTRLVPPQASGALY